MTISSTVRVAGPFIGNGTASTFPFTFKVFAAADLDVIRLAASTGVESTLVLNSDYSVALNGDQNTNPGGSITLLAGALASGFTLTITSDIANLQPTDLTNQGGFYPEVITDSLDRATIQIQQISDIGDRTLKIPISDGTGLDMELPTAAVRANSFLSFDANGEPTVVSAGSSGAPATITRQVFSGTGAQVAFTLASDPGALGNSAQVYIGGVYQQRSTYTIAGTTLMFSAAPVAGTDNIEFVNFLTSNIGATSADLVTYTPAGSGAVARSAASKFGDVISVKDFGASATASPATNTLAIQSAIAAANGKTVYIDEQLTCNPMTFSTTVIDIAFSMAGKLVFLPHNGDDVVFTSCTGRIRNYRATHSGDLGGGVFAGLLLQQCSSFVVDGFHTDGSKDIPVVIYDCDDTKIINGAIAGNTALRRYAGMVINSANSGFQNCSATTVSFGFVILGEGYKSGTRFPPVRTWEAEQGMFIRDCFVYDHTGHAFDINGAVGAVISRCVADTYTGTIGNASFQIKNSTNLITESPLDTRSSQIDNCISINGYIGFFCQSIRGGNMLNNIAIRSQSYAVYLNDADFVIVDGLDVEDWCLSALATGFNSETKVSAIGVATSSTDCRISNVNLRLKDTPNNSNMRLVFAGGSRTSLNYLRVQKISGASDVSEGLVIEGSNCFIGSQVIPAHAATQLTDIAQTTNYELSFGVTWAFSTATSAVFPMSPTRGMIVGSVNAAIVSGSVSGHQYSVGRVSDADQFVTLRTAATESLSPNGVSQSLNAGQRLQVFGDSGTGTLTMNIIVGGVAST